MLSSLQRTLQYKVELQVTYSHFTNYLLSAGGDKQAHVCAVYQGTPSCSLGMDQKKPRWRMLRR